MSDAPQGPGWWQASDGNWYPPEQAPSAPMGGDAGGLPGGVQPTKVDVGAALSYGWKKFIQYLGQLVVIVLVILGVQVLMTVIGNIVGGDGLFGQLFSFAFSVLGWLISMILAAGIVRTGLAITRGETPEPSLLFKTDHLGAYILASIIVGALGILGVLLTCGIGTIVLLVFSFFWPYYVLDQGNAAWEGITNSFRLVKDNLGGVVLFLIVATLLNVITCGLAIGVTLIAGAYVYKTLNGEPVAPV